MLTLNLKPILKRNGIEKPQRLIVSLGSSPSYATHLVHGRAISISFHKLGQLCIALNCTPNDLFDFIPDKQALPQDHALHSISKHETMEAISEISQLLHGLPLEKIKEIKGIIRENGQ